MTEVDPYKKMTPFELYGLMSKFIQDHRSDPLAEQMKPAWSVLRQAISRNPQSRSGNMTRDEAIAVSVKCRARDVNRTPNQLKSLQINAAHRIDSYVALGMLKLDEPKTAEDTARAVLLRLLGKFDHIMNALDANGLKIVEK